MIKSFIWTAIFWSLFTATNSVGDAIDFMERFPWYGNSRLWHFLKYWWIGFAVLSGVFALRLWMNVKYVISAQTKFKQNSADYTVSTVHTKKSKYRLKASLIFAFLLAWFIALRYFLFEGLMDKWKTL